MSNKIEIKVPDLGGASDVEVIEILVNVGDVVAQEDSLITLESDKASMDIPATASGKVTDIAVAVGDTINEGDTIISLESTTSSNSQPQTNASKPAQTTEPTPKEKEVPASKPISTSGDAHAPLVVIGSGPVSYTHLTLPTIYSV